MEIVVIGDSVVSGENNNFKSFTNYLPYDNVTKVGVSGTTIGEYSIYPVDGKSLLSQIRNYEKIIKTADVILLHYGVNDTSALALGNCSSNMFIINYVKAIDYLKQLNPKAKIKFLLMTDCTFVAAKYADLHVPYLKEYLKYMPIEFNTVSWFRAYGFVASTIKQKCEVISLFDDVDTLIRYLDKDKIHPNDEGYRYIAKLIERKLEEDKNEMFDYRN